MTTTNMQLFVNPIAGRGRAAKRLSRICDLAESQNVVFTVHTSRGVGDLERQVRRMVDSGRSRLVVAGGDGSIHEAVNGIMSAGGQAALGVIPTGTGNDFAKASGITLDWEQATLDLANRIVARQTWRRVDIGEMNGRYFANGAGIGFDAKVTQIARSYRWQIGDLVYLLAILRGMAEGIATPDFKIDAGGYVRRGPVTFANIANGAWIGGMFHLVPGADNSDGAFDLAIIDPVSRLRVFQLLPKLMRGQHIHEPEITLKAAKQVSIEAAEPVPCHLDGEVQPPQSRFEIRMLPGAISIL